MRVDERFTDLSFGERNFLLTRCASSIIFSHLEQIDCVNVNVDTLDVLLRTLGIGTSCAH